MNLNNLKPAWRQFRLYNSMQPVNREEILSILERAGGVPMSKNHRIIINSLMLIVFTFCCQGG